MSRNAGHPKAARCSFKHAVAILLLSTLLTVSCGIGIGLGPGGGFATITLFGATVTLTFGDVGELAFEANIGVTFPVGFDRVVDGTPEGRPGTGVMMLPSDNVSVGRLLTGKQVPSSQALPLNGTATIRFSVAPGSSPDLCDDATLLAEYDLVLTSGNVIITNESVTISQEAIDILITNNVTICVEILADFDGVIIIDDVIIIFGDEDGVIDTGETPPSAGTTIQVPIDNMAGQAVVSPVNQTVNGIDYSIAGVLEANTPDVLATPGSPDTISVDLNELGLANVDTLYISTHSSFVPDVPDGVELAVLSIEYAEGGAPTTYPFVTGSTTAEWSYDRPDHTTFFGGVQHERAPVLYSFETTIDSGAEYTAYAYAGMIDVDSARTISCMRLVMADPSSYAGVRPVSAPAPTWAGQAVMGITLVGQAGTPGLTTSPGCAGIPDSECTFGSECGMGEACINGECVPDEDTCGDEADCSDGESCIGGVCVPGLNCDVPGNLIVNCSFEDGPDFDTIRMLEPGDTTVTAWTVTRDQVDILGPPSLWAAFDGNRLVDLDGSPGVGGIEQTFTTTPGTRYVVTFAFSGNPEGGASIEQLRVSVAGEMRDYSFDTTGRTISDLGWTMESFTFEAQSSQTTIEFYSLSASDSSIHGPLIDLVTVMEETAGTDSCTIDSDCDEGELCEGGTCVVDTPDDGFTTATVVHRGAEQIIAGPNVDSSVSTVTPEGYGFAGYKATALSGDNTRVWFALFDQFPNVEGDPQAQLWSVNIDGSGGAQSSLPAGDLLSSGLSVETGFDGNVCYADNAAERVMYRAAIGAPATTAFAYFTDDDGFIFGDIRGEFAINDDVSAMIYRSFVDTKFYGVDLSTHAPVVVAEVEDVPLQGVEPRAVRANVDIAGTGTTWVGKFEYFSTDLTPSAQDTVIFGASVSASAGASIQRAFDDFAESNSLSITDDGQSIGYCTVGSEPGINPPNECYVESIGSATRETITDGRTSIGNLRLADDGSRVFYRTDQCCSGGTGIFQTIGTQERVKAGTQVFAPAWDTMRISDEGNILVGNSPSGVYVLHDGIDDLPDFPAIERIAYRFETEGEDCDLVVRVTAGSPRGIERIFTLPLIDGVDPTIFVDGELNPLFADRSGGGVNLSTTFTPVEGMTDVWERNVRLTNSEGVCIDNLLTDEYSIRIVVRDSNLTMTVFQDFRVTP